ncbi:MAG: polysaccharide deacetylase family protein [Gorillibacterium sp.]|nr:polysaccharide deacetylase family protein [Gorillibacterium sp.]
MNVRLNRFPGGKTKTVTLSFDDGREDDRRLVQVLNTYNLKGTFHLNSGSLGKEKFVTMEEAATLYQGHEISVHTVTHPFLDQISPECIVREIRDDRIALERLAGYPVRGMSYPFGLYTNEVVQLLPSLGIEYARTVLSTGKFNLPQDYLQWHPTCHHKQMVENAERFIGPKPWGAPMELLYVWGHSFEFENDGNWELIDHFGEIISGRDDIWYASNAQIATYAYALKRLRFTACEHMVENPSALSVWIDIDGEPIEIPAGALVQLN